MACAWRNEDELYNDGRAFKLTCRDRNRRNRHTHRGQLFRLLQEGGKDPDQLFGESCMACARKNTRAARWSFRAMTWAKISAATCTCSPMGHTFAEVCRAIRRRMEIRPEGYAVDRKYPGHHLRAGDGAVRPATATGYLAARGEGRNHQAIAGPHVCPAIRLQGAHGETGRPTGPGGWSAPSRKGPFATSRAPSRAAANRKFPSRSPTRSCTDRCSWRISRKISTGWTS